MLGVKMNRLRRLSRIFNSSKEINFDDFSKIIIMSDCHRGNGDWADTFAKNQNIFFTALNHYYNEEYTYIELGDGDELWQNRRMSGIIREHFDAFWLMSKFYNEGRLYFIYGNHDIDKKDQSFLDKNFNQFFSERERKYIQLFTNVKVHEGLVLKHKNTDDKIFLVHGHQVDFLNYELWRLAKILVRYLWRPLEAFGVNDPTRTAKNYKKKEFVERILAEWVEKEKHMLIAGHNHRPRFPEVGAPPYFNDGSCVHPRGITGIEIIDGNILLVKWSIKSNEQGILFIGRDILAGPNKLMDYFRSL